MSMRLENSIKDETIIGKIMLDIKDLNASEIRTYIIAFLNSLEKKYHEIGGHPLKYISYGLTLVGLIAPYYFKNA